MLGLFSEAWRTLALGFQCVDFCVNTSFGTPGGTRRGIIIMDFPMDMTKFQEVINQAVHQAMINLSNGLSNTVHSVVRGGYQYYASAP